MIQRTPLFLIANLGSEVAKILKAKAENDWVVLSLAKKRATCIISELKNFPETKNNIEIDILKDVIFDLTEKKQKYKISPQNLKSYFYPFAMRLNQI